MVIGVIGYGVVGRAVWKAFVNKTTILINDVEMPEKSSHIKTLCEQCSFIFICVPTPMSTKTGNIDTRIVDKILETISKQPGNPVVILKSTVIPSQLKYYQETYPDLRLVMSPEYLTDANPEEDFINAELLVLGGKDKDIDEVEMLFKNYSDCRPCPVGKCDLIGAGVLKYMENCFLAMKVTFMNQFFDVLQQSGSKTTWNEIAQIFQLDSRMGHSHYMVPGPDGDRGWGGKCLPKDLNAILNESKKLGYNLDLIEKIIEFNATIRKDKDWLRIKGATS